MPNLGRRRERRGAGSGALHPGDGALQARANPQEQPIGALEQSKDDRRAGDQAQGTQDRDGAPHGRKSGSSRVEPFAFEGVKAREQGGPIDRAGGPSWRGHVEKFDPIRTVETAHQGDLAAAQRALAIVPYRHARHGRQIVNVASGRQREQAGGTTGSRSPGVTKPSRNAYPTRRASRETTAGGVG
jgi:hypothetical protein